MKNPFVKNFNELLIRIHDDFIENPSHFLCIASPSSDSIFDELLVQSMVRYIDGYEVKFCALRNIVLKEEYKSHRLFDEFIHHLEDIHIPLLAYDIVNPELKTYFKKRDYRYLKDKKQNYEVDCFFYLPNYDLKLTLV